MLYRSGILTLLAGALLAGAPAAGTVVQVGGLAVELSVAPVSPVAGVPAGELREGADAVFHFKIVDSATGTPLTGVSPAAWVESWVQAPVTESRSCKDTVEELISSSVLSRPEIDLNAYQVLALNGDASISVIDPVVGFGGSRLLAMVFLDSPGEDWVLSSDQKRLFVSLPDSNRVAVVDTASWQVLASVEVGSRPGRLALQPDGAYLWVTLEGGGVGGSREVGVAALDTARLQVAARIPVGLGRHELALSDDNRFVYVTSGEDRTLSVIDVAKLAKTGEAPLNAVPTSVAYSPIAKAVYVTSEEQGVVVAVSGAVSGTGKPEVLARMPADPGIGAIRFAPGGRLGFVVNPRINRIYILDASRNRIVQTGTVEPGPDQVTFTDHLAYVRHRGSEIVLMIPLDQVGEEGKPVPVVDFPAGEKPLGQIRRPSPASSIVQAPVPNSVLVANPADEAIYFYKEGMAAPMGSFRNYAGEPRAVLVVDRSLKERSPGVYETVARLTAAGTYQVAFFLDSPRAVHCFDLAIAQDPEVSARRLREQPAVVEPLFDPALTLPAGQPAKLRFKLSEPGTGKAEEGLGDVVVLAYRTADNWQVRRPARALGNGVYEAEIVPTREGSFHVAVECPSRKLPFHLSPQLILKAVSTETPPSP